MIVLPSHQLASSASLTEAPESIFQLILKAKCETNCIVTGENAREKTARPFLPMPSSFQKKISVKCLKTQPCAFNCLDGFLFCFLIIISLVHLMLQLLPQITIAPFTISSYIPQPIERLLSLISFGLSTSSAFWFSDCAQGSNLGCRWTDTGICANWTNNMAAVSVIAQQLSCPVHLGGKTNKHYKLKKWENEMEKSGGGGRMSMLLKLLFWGIDWIE